MIDEDFTEAFTNALDCAMADEISIEKGVALGNKLVTNAVKTIAATPEEIDAALGALGSARVGLIHDLFHEVTRVAAVMETVTYGLSTLLVAAGFSPEITIEMLSALIAHSQSGALIQILEHETFVVPVDADRLDILHAYRKSGVDDAITEQAAAEDKAKNEAMN